MRKLLVGLSLFLGLGTAHAQYQAVITTGTQTIYGTKIFNDYLITNGLFRSYGVAEFGSSGQFILTDNGDISLSQGLTISGGSVTVVDDLKASNFSGNGSALTHITAVYASSSGVTDQFAVVPSSCPTGQAARGIYANGNSLGCFTPSGSGDMSTTASTTTNAMVSGAGIGLESGAQIYADAGSTVTVSTGAWLDIGVTYVSACGTASNEYIATCPSNTELLSCATSGNSNTNGLMRVGPNGGTSRTACDCYWASSSPNTPCCIAVCAHAK